MGLPLADVHRDHTVFFSDTLTELHNNTYIEFMCTFKLEGNEFKADSKCVYDELKLRIIDYQTGLK